MTDTKSRVPILTEYWCVKGDSERFETTHNGEIEARARELYQTPDALRAAILATGRCSEWLLDKYPIEQHLYYLYTYTPEYRPIREVIADLNACLKGLGIVIDEYGWDVTHSLKDAFGASGGYVGEPHLWPSHNCWIAVYAVTGGSEGHYMHLDLIHKGEATRIALAKTFQGMEFAYDVCKATAMILEA